MCPVIYVPSGKALEYAPYAANLYRGCSHGCKYCYAPACQYRKPEDFFANPSARPDVLRQIEADAKKMNTSGPVLLCFTCDPYQPLDESIGLTRKAIIVLKKYGKNVNVLTKGGMRASRDFDLLGTGDAFASTLTFVSPLKSKEWEPLAALPHERLLAIKEAKKRGIPTWVSLEPVIDPEETIELVKMTLQDVDLYKVGILNHHELTKTIEWASFGKKIISLLESHGKKYYIKKDLRKYIDR